MIAVSNELRPEFYNQDVSVGCSLHVRPVMDSYTIAETLCIIIGLLIDQSDFAMHKFRIHNTIRLQYREESLHWRLTKY